ncbi:MAG: hypothetical protein ACYTFK_13960 [Planctomycetota bacterium]|jgi:hypothetical protein
MPDNIKVSLNNAIVIVGFILTVGISYSAIASRIGTNESLDDRQGIRIDKLELGAVRAQSERNEARIRDEYTVDSLRRIEEWIKEIDEIRISGE